MSHVRTALAGAVAILTATLATACGSSGGNGNSGSAGGSTSDTDLTVTVTPGFTGDTSLYLAADKGFFSKHHISPSFVNVSTQPIQPIFSDSAQVATASPAVAVAAAAQGQTPKVIVTLQSRITQAVLVRKDVADRLHLTAGRFPDVIKKLKGLTLGISTRGGSVDLDLRYILTEAGLTPDKDVKLIPLGAAAQMIAAMKGGQVDGVLGYSPMQYQLEADGTAVNVLDLSKGQGPSALDQPFLTAVVTGDYLKNNPSVVKNFTAAMQESCDYIKDSANADGVASVVKKRFNTLDSAAVDSVVKEVQGTCDTGFTDEQFDNVLEVNKNSLNGKKITADQVLASGVVPGRQAS
jgi:ABC-type nitrate/sulfonate/bicarbonate transport system substrate-binding protein